MEYIHIRNLEKYHPGYKDRKLQYAKIFIDMADGDPDTEMIPNEIDWARFVKMILLELRAQKPLPNDNNYWIRKGFDLKKRPMSLTLQMLHGFIERRNESVTQIREEEDKEKNKNGVYVTEFFNYFLLKTKKSLKLTPERKTIIERRLNEGRTLEELKRAVDNFVNDDWPDRHKFLDIVYCIGVRNKIDNLDKWLNAKPKKVEPKPNPKCTACNGTGYLPDKAKCWCW